MMKRKDSALIGFNAELSPKRAFDQEGPWAETAQELHKESSLWVETIKWTAAQVGGGGG